MLLAMLVYLAGVWVNPNKNPLCIVATPDTQHQQQNGCLWRAWCNDALIFL